MKNLEKIVITLAVTSVLVLAGAIGAFVSQFSSKGISFGGVSQTPAVSYWTSQTATSGTVSLTSSDVRLVATSAARQFVYVSAGQGCSQGFYVSMANDAPATVSNGHFVASSSSFEINTVTKAYMGGVHAISNGGTCSVNVSGN